MAFAEGTTVAPEKTMGEIFALLRKHGADEYGTGAAAGRIGVSFRIKGRRVRFDVAAPSPADKEVIRRARGGRTWGTPEPARLRAALEQEERRLWRCLLLTIKAKFEAIESKIETFEESFLAHLVTENGETVMQRLLQPGPGRLLPPVAE